MENFSALTINRLADYVGFLADQSLAPASVARHLVALKMFFRFCSSKAFAGKRGRTLGESGFGSVCPRSFHQNRSTRF
jgi:site-specific recombinase XerD